jgi:hypothetical protein
MDERRGPGRGSQRWLDQPSPPEERHSSSSIERQHMKKKKVGHPLPAFFFLSSDQESIDSSGI